MEGQNHLNPYLLKLQTFEQNVKENCQKDVGLIQDTNLDFKEDKLEVKTLIEDIISSFKMQAQIKSIDLSYSVNESIPRFIECDKGRLWQILFILVYNAIKYTNQGYVKIKIESTQQDLEQEDENCQILNIKIQDSGCGILKENAPNIFKFLHNIKQKQNVNQNGMGLGLTICGKIIKAWGGQIDFKSVVGDGTEFDLKIPFKNVQSDSDGSLRLQSFDKVSKYNLNPKTFSDLNQSTKYRILLVDDDAFNLYSLGLLIKTRGNYKCDNVMNGYDAIKRLKDSFKLKEEPYRLILMDLNMPLIDGMQTSIILRQLHESHEIDLTNTKIFLHSAIQHTLEDKDGVFDGILEKPISFKELDGILSSL
ncbi:multi-sensor hybrid histidine kinase [Stylonychia lemnae]|uniref:Multi-sensor hybrid histidine kinase n=1 Tax=Stylonychia lemnae TaxID=5949 RepID=A0A078AVJ4_STYLE|nr:multi-sensor hybrid histidine kinase [Stylonychia lemnae]|eukprot:CDW86209.1 multi-sensor hybrid histidine kinase [Stylonychia lemnae]